MWDDKTTICILAVYGCLITIILLMTIYLYMKRKTTQCATCKEQRKHKNLTEKNRASVDNKYESDSPKSVYRNKSLPSGSSQLPEYESMASLLKPQTSHQPEIHHQYETIEEKVLIHHYDIVGRSVAGSVSAILDRPKTSDDITKQFLKTLPKVIEQVIQREWEKRVNNRKMGTEKGMESDNETYVKYCPEMSKSGKLGSKSFGSTDHLRYICEKKDSGKEINELPYLEPKKFRARSNCPEELRQLMKNQESPSETSPGPNRIIHAKVQDHVSVSQHRQVRAKHFSFASVAHEDPQHPHYLQLSTPAINTMEQVKEEHRPEPPPKPLKLPTSPTKSFYSSSENFL